MNMFECPFSFFHKKTPNNIALIENKISLSYRDCNEMIEGMVNNLKKAGVKQGDKVPFFPNKKISIPLLFFALFRLGAIACPLNIYLPKNMIPQILDELGSLFFISNNQEPNLQIKQIVLPLNILFKDKGKPNESFLNKEAHATYLFTSGTTAKPKIACHSLGNHYYSALGSNACMPIDHKSYYLLSLPLYHIGGIAILFRTFLSGGTVIISENSYHLKATHLSFVPTQLYRFLKNVPQGSLRHILLGGDSISPTLVRKAQKYGYNIYPTYGMTEMSSQITTHFEPHTFSLGHPLPYREIKIGNNREILVRGKPLFKGYFDFKSGLHLPCTKNGWFVTGDLGKYSLKKGLQLIGRKDRLFISGGENIHPEEIEKVLVSIEGIDLARVSPIFDKEFGFRPIAHIKTKKKFNRNELKGVLALFLPKFKIPVEFFPL